MLVFNHTIPFKEIDLNIQQSEKYKIIKDIYFTYKKDIYDNEGNRVLEKDFSNLTKADFEKQLSDVLKSKNIKKDKRCLEVLYEELNQNEVQLEIADGFSKNNRLELFEYKPEINRNLFFLHGAFHLYKDKKKIYKISRNTEKALYDVIDEILDNESKDLICVFNNESKIDEINNCEYLKDSLDEISNLNGNIVIIGSSLDENDKHIFEEINNSNISKVYFASTEKEYEYHNDRMKLLFPNKEIVLYDRESVSYDKVSD